MKGFVSLLKGRKFKNGKNYNSLFLIKEEKKKELNQDENEPDYFPPLENTNHSKIYHLKDNKSNVFKTKKNKIIEDYEDLFFYFLKISEKIEDFEIPKEKNKNSKNKLMKENYNENKFEDEEKNLNNQIKTDKIKLNINEIFYHEIYLKLKNNKIHWKNFLFSKGVYKIMYKKSRIKQKEILKYCLKYNRSYESIINSYEKKYTSVTSKHNWELTPFAVYHNYKKLFKKDLSESKKLNERKINYLEADLSDIVLKVDNSGKGKTLIYVGKNINIYLDDYFKNDTNNNLISMQVQESIAKQKYRKETVYNYNDILPKSKYKLKSNFSYNRNKNINKKLENNKNIFMRNIQENNSYKNLIFSKNRKKINSLEPIRNNLGFGRNNTESNKFITLNEERNRNLIFDRKDILKTDKNNDSFHLEDKVKNNNDYFRQKKKNKGLSKIEDYKHFIMNQKQNNIINNKDIDYNSFSPKISKPIILKENSINFTKNNNEKSNQSNNTYFSKLNLKQKIKNQKLGSHKNKKHNILNFFSNTSFYY